MSETGKGLSYFVKFSIFMLLTMLDIVVIGACLLVLFSWLCDPLVIELEVLRKIIPFAWPIIVFAVCVVGIRILVRKLLNRFVYETPGPLDLAAFRVPAYLLLLVAGLLVALELILISADVNEPLPEFVDADTDGGQLKTGGFIEPDPVMIWKYAAGSNYTHGAINELGYLGNVPSEVKGASSKRIVCLGGTTTCRGTPSYPNILEEKLNQTSGDTVSWEVYDCSVEHYSISQGLQVFRDVSSRYQPDFVLIYFGWDDHWKAGSPDSTRMGVRKTSEAQSLFSLMSKKRFVQMIDNSQNSARNLARKINPSSLRVPLREYEWALLSLIHEIQASGAKPILIIPPGGQLREDIVVRGLVGSLQEAINLHAEFNNVSRKIAVDNKVTMVDFVEFIRKEVPTRFALDNQEPVPLFEADGMVLTEVSRNFLVEQLQLKLH